MTPLNPWREVVLGKAARLFEDSDRTTFAASRFSALVRRAHRLATTGAHAAPEPRCKRHVLDDGVLLSLEWLDSESGWFLELGVKRRATETPRVVLDFWGNPKSYTIDKPTDADISQALHDYFQAWKGTP